MGSIWINDYFIIGFHKGKVKYEESKIEVTLSSTPGDSHRFLAIKNGVLL